VEQELYAGQIIEFLTKELEERLPVNVCSVSVRQGPSLVNDENLVVACYSRPRSRGFMHSSNTPWLENSQHQFKVSISAGRAWQRNRPVPDKVQIEQLTKFGLPTMRKMTGTPEKVMAHLLKYVDKNRELLLRDDLR
jgi:type III secretory pathway component EscV